MTILQFNDVGYDLPDAPLFDGVSLTLARGERIALVGENGAGKSTLLHLAAEELEPDRGRVSLTGQVALMPQHLPERPDVPGSGGELQRRRLEALFARSADLYLLDEPTHHLDVDNMLWLEQQLLDSGAAVLLVSHDREFLDAVATGVAFLERGKLSVESGNYSEATSRREDDEAAQLRRHNVQGRKRASLQREFHRQRSRANSAEKFNPRRADGQPLILAKGKAESVARTFARRARALEARLEREEVEEKPWQDNRRLEFVAQPATPGPNEVITAEGLVVRRGGKVIVGGASKDGREAEGGTLADPASAAGVDLHVRRGDRIALVGPNGSGKTTLLGVLRGVIAPDAGTVRMGIGLQVAVSDQAGEPWSALGEDHGGDHGGDQSGRYLGGATATNAETVGDVLYQVNERLLDAEVWRVTAAVGVPSGPQRPLADLSGGERRRLTLARIAVSHGHLLVLDEPTHHLDLRAVEALEGLLETFSGTLLLATHDRRLVDRVATRVWRLGGQHGLEEEL